MLWTQSINKISTVGLQQILSISEFQAQQISIIAAQGVFTSTLEWIVISLASGAKVHVKAPATQSAAIAVICNHFAAAGFPITHSLERSIPSSDLIFAFGDDNTIANIENEHPNSLVRGYGHKFSVAICNDTEQEAKDVAISIAAYDSRGCMAPVAIFCIGDSNRFHHFLATAMAELQQSQPMGKIDPNLGPEIRRKIGLAKVKGSLLEGEGWKVLQLPAELFTPVALPRMPVIHPVSNVDQIQQILKPWAQYLSILGCNHTTGIESMFHRNTTLCDMQNPPFPRQHDGKAMWITNTEYS